MNKLVEISTGKWSCIPHREKSVEVQQRNQGFGTVRSLNFVNRKRETERIERENHAFAKRLFERGASLSKKKFDDDYQMHMKYKNQI